MHDLEIVWPEGSAQFAPADSPILIGRSADSAVPLVQGSVSRRHLKLEWTGSAWSATDTSTHGTFDPIGVKLSPRWTIGTDTTVRVGGTEGIELQFRLLRQATEDITQTSPAGPDNNLNGFGTRDAKGVVATPSSLPESPAPPVDANVNGTAPAPAASIDHPATEPGQFFGDEPQPSAPSPDQPGLDAQAQPSSASESDGNRGAGQFFNDSLSDAPPEASPTSALSDSPSSVNPLPHNFGDPPPVFGDAASGPTLANQAPRAFPDAAVPGPTGLPPGPSMDASPSPLNSAPSNQALGGASIGSGLPETPAQPPGPNSFGGPGGPVTPDQPQFSGPGALGVPGSASTVISDNILRLSADGEDYSFSPGTEITIGRDPSCLIQLDERHSLVSRRHLKIQHSGDGWWFEDFSSKGTFIDNRRLKGRYKAQGAFVANLGDNEAGTPVRVITAGEHKAPSNNNLLLTAALGALVLLPILLIIFLVTRPKNDALQSLTTAKQATVMLIGSDEEES